MLNRLSNLMDRILPSFSPKQLFVGIFFILLGMMGMDMISKLGEEGCNILICQSPEVTSIIGVSLFLAFLLPTAIGGLVGNFLQSDALMAAIFLASVPISMLYCLYLTKPALWIWNKASYLTGKALSYLESDQEPEMEPIEFFEQYGIQMIVGFSLMFAMISFLHYPRIQIDLGLSEFLLLATADTAIITYVLNLFGEEIESETKDTLKKISFFVLMITLVGAATVFLTSNSVGQSSTLDKASFTGLKMFIVTMVLGGFGAMVYFPMMALTEDNSE